MVIMIYVAGSAGLLAFGADLTPMGSVIGVDELLYLVADPTGRWLFGVSGVDAGFAHTWQIDGPRITPVGRPVSTGGTEPCHIALDRAGRLLIVTNYGSGSIAVLPIDDDGHLGPAQVCARYAPTGPDAARQDGPHVHQTVIGPDDEVIVTDLGADQVISYRLVDGGLIDPVVSAAPPGSGPRHLVLLPAGGVAVTGELTSSLLLARRAGREFIDWRAVPATGRAQPERNYPSDLLTSDDGAALYLANRGADSVAVFTADGRLVREITCSAWPRQMCRDGSKLLIAATKANRLDVLDLDTGLVTSGPTVVGAMCVVVISDQSREN